MRVLAVVLPEAGHFHAFIGLAQSLERAGHEVTFFCAEDLRPRLERAGLRATCRSLGTPAAAPADARSAGYTARLRKPAWARRWYARVLLAPVAAHVEALHQLVRELRPDVVCADPSMYAAGIVASREGLPWASIAPTLVVVSPPGFSSPYHDALAELEPERAALFQTFGVEVPCKVGEMISPWFNSVFSTEAFTPRARAANAFSHYVGPSSPIGARGDEPDFPWGRLEPGIPLVYASFGTQVSPPADVFTALAGAITAGRAQLVLALGDRFDEPFVAGLPDHVIAVRYAPQLSLLERAAVVVTHGGANTVIEALHRGVPMVVLPLAHEQALQGHLVAAAGAGTSLAVEDATVERCRAELERLIEAGPHRAAAERIQRSFAATDAAATLRDALVTLAETRRPLAVEPLS